MTTKTVTLAAIATKIKMNPKVARAKARRGAFRDIKRTAPWVFPTKDERRVVKALKSGAA